MVSLSDYLEFEEQVADFITSALRGRETIVLNEYINGGKGLNPDIILPQGCALLQFPPNTIIECVYRITFDTVSRILSRYHSLLEEKQVVIVFLESSAPGNIVDDRIGLRSFDDLKALLPPVAAGDVVRRDWMDERKKRIGRAMNDVLLDDVTLFLGAGVSIDANLPSWNELLRRMEVAINSNGGSVSYDKVTKDAGNSTLITARALRMHSASDETFGKIVRASLFQKPSQKSVLVDSIANVIRKNGSRVKSVITFNFDNVLEQNLMIPHCSITDENRIDPGKFPVFHVHGFIPESPIEKSSRIVFSEESYHEIYKSSYHWSNIEQLHALANTTCFFIGLSMIDPNLRRLLDIASERDKSFYHYAFLRRPEFKDPDTVDKMLSDLHVRVIWFMRFSQLPKMITTILG